MRKDDNMQDEEGYCLTMEEACEKMREGFALQSNHLGLIFFQHDGRFVTDEKKIPFDELSQKDAGRRFKLLTRRVN